MLIRHQKSPVVDVVVPQHEVEEPWTLSIANALRWINAACGYGGRACAERRWSPLNSRRQRCGRAVLGRIDAAA
jgi:hypothetical protein